MFFNLFKPTSSLVVEVTAIFSDQNHCSVNVNMAKTMSNRNKSVLLARACGRIMQNWQDYPIQAALYDKFVQSLAQTLASGDVEKALAQFSLKLDDTIKGGKTYRLRLFDNEHITTNFAIGDEDYFTRVALLAWIVGIVADGKEGLVGSVGKAISKISSELLKTIEWVHTSGNRHVIKIDDETTKNVAISIVQSIAGVNE